MYLPVLVVLGVLGSEAAGFFESGHRIVMVFLGMLGVYFTNIFPAMSATSHSSYYDFTRLIGRALRTTLGATIAVCIITVWLAPTIIDLVFGSKYVNSQCVETFRVLACLAPVLALRRTWHSALIVMNQQRSELLCSTLGVGLLVAFLFLMTRSLGVAGAAWAMLTSEVAATALTWVVLRRRLRAAGVERAD
jgi:PST family polysaccharide transporter